MKYELFNQLYIEALEESDLECYIAERGWQERMESYEAQEIADILTTIHKLANSTLAECREGSRAEFSRRFGIPLRTLEDWDKNRYLPRDYVIKFIKYIIFMDNYETATSHRP
jgi:DNA-binding transcriptional regulator YiaG